MKLKKTDRVPKLVLEDKEVGIRVSSIKHIATILFITSAFTFGTAACFHLILVFVTAFVRHDLSLINPMEFLGIGLLFPELNQSTAALLLGWIFLVILFWLVYRTITGFDNIIAFWYTSETYNNLAISKKHIFSSILKIRSSVKSDYQLKKLVSVQYLTKIRKKK